MATVTATGPNSTIGRLAALLDTGPRVTPLQRRLQSLSRILALIPAILCISVAIIGLLVAGRSSSLRGHACRYARWRREPAGSKPALSGIDRHAAHRIVAAAVAEGAGWQPVAVTRALMACYGIPLLDTQLATTAEQAETVARDLGFPVVMKATRPGLVHKAEAGGVHLGLSDGSAVVAAYRSIASSLGEAEPEVALQPMVQTGVELVVGVVHDALFGSLVMVGLGGVHTDVLGDRSFRSLPLTDQDAAGMWRELQAATLLTGYRGAPAMGTDALERSGWRRLVSPGRGG